MPLHSANPAPLPCLSLLTEHIWNNALYTYIPIIVILILYSTPLTAATPGGSPPPAKSRCGRASRATLNVPNATKSYLSKCQYLACKVKQLADSDHQCSVRGCSKGGHLLCFQRAVGECDGDVDPVTFKCGECFRLANVSQKQERKEKVQEDACEGGGGGGGEALAPR